MDSINSLLRATFSYTLRARYKGPYYKDTCGRGTEGGVRRDFRGAEPAGPAPSLRLVGGACLTAAPPPEPPAKALQPLLRLSGAETNLSLRVAFPGQGVNANPEEEEAFRV